MTNGPLVTENDMMSSRVLQELNTSNRQNMNAGRGVDMFKDFENRDPRNKQ